MKTLLICAALAASAPAFTRTALPAPPTLHANARFKGLQFDWAPAANATSYQLEYRAHQTGSFVKIADLAASRTSTGFSFPLHLFDWTYARYRLAACNSAGCSRSTEVSVSALRLDAVGYFKAAQNVSHAGLGDDVDLSPDGNNFVAAAPGETIDDNGTMRPGGAVYVFRRESNGAWTQRARLTPSIPYTIDGINAMNVAISASGNTVVVGMPYYWHQDMDTNGGEVQVFHWNGTRWTRTSIPRVPGAVIFGNWVAVADTGFTLAVGLSGTGTEVDTAIYKFVNGSWQDVRDIPGLQGAPGSCQDAHALSRDGFTFARLCQATKTSSAPERHFVQTFSGSNWNSVTEIPLVSSAPSQYGYANRGLGISANGDTIAAGIAISLPENSDAAAPQVNVFKRTNGVYEKTAELTRGAWSQGDGFNFYGLDVAVSGDGNTIVVGDSADIGRGWGPRAAPLIAGTAKTGAVYVYRLSATWKLANMVKPNYHPNGTESFGRELALNENGQTLIVGEGAESSDSNGIGGNWQNAGAVGSGAIWMY